MKVDQTQWLLTLTKYDTRLNSIELARATFFTSTSRSKAKVLRNQKYRAPGQSINNGQSLTEYINKLFGLTWPFSYLYKFVDDMLSYYSPIVLGRGLSRKI